MEYLIEVLKIGLSGVIVGTIITYIGNSYSLYKNFIIDNEKELNDYKRIQFEI